MIVEDVASGGGQIVESCRELRALFTLDDLRATAGAAA